MIPARSVVSQHSERRGEERKGKERKGKESVSPQDKIGDRHALCASYPMATTGHPESKKWHVQPLAYMEPLPEARLGRP